MGRKRVRLGEKEGQIAGRVRGVVEDERHPYLVTRVPGRTVWRRLALYVFWENWGALSFRSRTRI